MLAFNLSVFFRNLRGQPVRFKARDERAEVAFEGGVLDMQEQTDLSHHLTVTLARGELLCRIAFADDEDGDVEYPDESEVAVRLVQRHGDGEALLLETHFRFGDIALQPAGEPEEG